jgi:hypothetical protein
MKSKEEIIEISEKIFPYDPYENQFFPGTRQAKINGFVSGYTKAQEDIINLLKNSENLGNSLEELMGKK